MKRTTSAKDIKQVAALKAELTKTAKQSARWEARTTFLEGRARAELLAERGGQR